MSTQLGSNDPSSFADLCFSNRENLLRWIDAYATSLAKIRQDLVESESAAMVERLESVVEERNKWILDRAEGQWEAADGVQMPAKSSMMSDIFLGGWWRKRSGKES
jgi:hypothetical protein